MKINKDHPAMQRFMDECFKNMCAWTREHIAVEEATDSKEKEHHERCRDALQGLYSRDAEVIGRMKDIEQYYEDHYRKWLYIGAGAIGVAVGFIVMVLLFYFPR